MNTGDDVIPPPLPLPFPSVTSTHSRRSSSISASSHAFDISFNVRTSDSDESDLPAYMDIEGQNAYKKSDMERIHSIRHTIYTVFRGRAMPIRPLFISTMWAVIATVITWATRVGYPPHENGECRWWCTPLAIDGDALSYVGFALFLLTSFRVSEAYSRYMEGLRLWTMITGTITSTAKYIVQAFAEDCFHKGDRERILGFLVAFAVTLKRELRDEKDLRELKSVLSDEDLARLQNSSGMSSYCLYVLSGYLLEAKQRETQLPQTFIVHLIRWIADLAGAADNCNQIKSIPAPYSYITHLNTFLALWLFFLPFALVETTGWGTILIVAFISYGILGVVANAAELENPFGSDYNDLPLGRIGRNIQDSVADIYHSSKSKRERTVCQVADENLRLHPDYWLRRQKTGQGSGWHSEYSSGGALANASTAKRS